jgi:hypothetical protein
MVATNSSTAIKYTTKGHRAGSSPFKLLASGNGKMETKRGVAEREVRSVGRMAQPLCISAYELHTFPQGDMEVTCPTTNHLGK